jgi:O-antigen/teichoic acid export membrane protein
MGVMNLTTYGFTILAARVLGPTPYGALAAIMGLLLVVNVVSLGLQATGARRVSAAPEHAAAIEPQILSVSYRSAVALGLLCLLAAPVVDAMLRLDSWVPAVLLAVTAVPLTVMGGQAGVLQGERRWQPLALLYLTTGVGRFACGALALLWQPDETGAMVGVTVGAFLPVVVGWFALRHRSPAAAGDVPRDTGHPQLRLLREVGHNSHALFAFFALSNADVVIARSVLDEHQAGLYAAGLILTKAVLFAPQFVVVVAFPAMSQAAGRRRGLQLKGLALVLGIGGAAVAAAWLLSGLAVLFVGGPQYADLRSQLWLFAVLGTLLAMIQVLVYSFVARQSQRSVFVIWAALVVLVAAAVPAGSYAVLLAVVLIVDTTLLGVLLALTLRAASAPAAARQQPASVAR